MERDLEFFYRLKAEQQAEQARRLEEARRTSDKEPFDYQRLVGLLSLATPPSPAQAEYYYYVVYSRVRTLEDMARALEEADLYDGGDMHLDSG